MNQSNRFNTIVSAVTQSVVLIYQVIAVIIFVVSLFSAYAWLKNPFIGGFFEQTLILNGSDTREAGEHWALYDKGFKLGDQLVSVAGTPISNSTDLLEALEMRYVGENVSVAMRTLEGVTKEVQITLESFSSTD